MTELALIEKGTIKFYGRYVDDTLLVVKPSQIDRIHKAFNKFDKNIKLTVDRFDNEVPHFLDIEITPDGLNSERTQILANTLILKALPHGDTVYSG